MKTSAGQASLYLASLSAAEENAYNVPTVVEVDGALTDAALRDAGRRLAAATPSLRLRFGLDLRAAQVMQWFSDPDVDVDVVHSDDDRPIAEIAEELSLAPFDVEEGRLSRIVGVQQGHRSALVVVNHHLAIDGTTFHALAMRIGSALAGDGDPLHHPLRREVVRDGVVLGRPVVPERHRTHGPSEPALVLRAARLLEQPGEQPVAVGGRQTEDPRRVVRIDVENLPAGLRVRPHHRMLGDRKELPGLLELGHRRLPSMRCQRVVHGD